MFPGVPGRGGPPAGTPLYAVPTACAASSITGIPARSAAARIGSRSAGAPAKWTGMTAFVRGVILAASASGRTWSVP